MSQLPRLYLITDRKQCKKPLLEVIQESLEAGVRFIQLREKDLDTKELYQLADSVRKLSTDYSALFIINDRIDIALGVEADGLHIGKKSLPIEILKKILPKKTKPKFPHKFLIGYSAHSLLEAQKLQEQGVDFLTFSPIYPSSSKKNVSPQGIEKLKEFVKGVKIPVFALGGINEDNTQNVMDSTYGVALISEIMASSQPFEKANRLVQLTE